MPRAGDVDGSSLIRRDPAPLFRRDRSRLSALWSLIRVFTALPFTLVASTVSYLSGAQPRWKTLPATWFFALRKLQSSHLTPLVDPLEWDQPPPASSLVPEVVSGRLARRGMGCERVIVGPVSEELIGGMANVAQVKSVPRPSWMTWPARSTGDSAAKVYAGGKGFEKARSDEKVLYYLVGGAYVRGHPLALATAWRMSADTNLRLFGLNYRKTIDAESAHPAPLIDALAGWIHLVQVVGFRPENVVLVGDSAGGNLCMLLSRYLHFLSTSRPPEAKVAAIFGLPSAMCLISPWCDFSLQSDRFPSQRTNAHADFLLDLDQPWFHASLRHYDEAKARTSVWFSPALGLPGDWEFLKDNGTKVFISYGSAERFMDEIIATAESMRQAGVEIELYRDEGGIHVCPLVPGRGLEPWKAWSEAWRAFLL